MKVISIGEALLDSYGNEDFIGGAPLNFSIHMNRLGHKVFFISAVGDDTMGHRVIQSISNHGLSTKYITRVNNYSTGYVNVIKDIDSQPSYIIHRPAAYDYPTLTSEQINDITSSEPEWLYFGTVQQMSVVALKLTCKLINLLPKARHFYDMNLRTGHYTSELIIKLLEFSSILKLNKVEVHYVCKLFNKKYIHLENFCKWVANEFDLEGVCITMGSDGCAIYLYGEYLESPGYQVEVVDPVGAGDAFSAGFLNGFSENWKIDKVCDFANRLGSIVIKGKGAIPEWAIEDVRSLTPNIC